MSSLRTLEPPPIDTDTENNTAGSNSNDDTTWDSTYERDLVPTSAVGSPTLCPHAVSVGRRVYGVQAPTNKAHEDEREHDEPDSSESCWTTWQQALSDGLVECLASNRRGTVVAAASDTGVVTLLRGCDGTTLASRQVVPTSATASPTTGSSGSTSGSASTTLADTAVHLTWLSTTGHANVDTDDDVLVMEAPGHPPADASNNGSNDSNATTSLIVVSNIAGADLNRVDHPAVVAQAARNMSIQRVTVPQWKVHGATTAEHNNHNTKDAGTGRNNYDDDLRALTACVLPTAVKSLRFVACHSDGTLAVLDYSLEENDLQWVQRGMEVDGGLGSGDTTATDDSGDDWLIDFDVGLHPQYHNDKPFILGSAVSQHAPLLFWFDPSALETACRFALPRSMTSISGNTTAATSRSGHSSPPASRVVALEPLASSDPDALAVAVAVKVGGTSRGANETETDPTVGGCIRVIQVLTDDTLGLLLLTQPHILYTIPTDTTSLSVTLSHSSDRDHPFAFRYKIWRNNSRQVDDACTYHEFTPPTYMSRAMGTLRSCLGRGDFDQADRIVANIGVDVLVRHDCSNFHPSEIALQRLRHCLTRPSMDAWEQAALCLRRLAAGAVTGNPTGMALLETAVRTVTESPSQVPLPQFVAGLDAVGATLTTVLAALPEDCGGSDATESSSSALRIQQTAVAEQSAALQFLTQWTQATNAPALTAPFHTIRSPSHLFAVLVAERRFDGAARLYRSALRPKLTLDALIRPLWKLRADVAPQAYVSLLTEVAWPNLVVHDEWVSRLQGWACRMADDLDDLDQEGRNLDAAIVLLQAVDKGVRKLQLKIHASFGSFSPFVEKLEPRPFRRSSPRGISSDGHGDRSFSTAAPSASKATNSPHDGHTPASLGVAKPIPTLLERGALKGGAAMSHLRPSKDDAYDRSDECVKEKLNHALCLRRARSLGLERRTATLRTLVSQGGFPCIGKALVHLLSASCDTHEARIDLFTTTLHPFCASFDICPDAAMLDCTIGLCRGKNVSKRAIEESCSIAKSCNSVIVRCHVVLAVLRAALLCGNGHNTLLELSKEAMQWASCDSGLQSEVEEASRLLQIDGIVLQYCGSGAKELFRVDNPRHSTRLLDFVAKHVNEDTVLADVLSLCDAFHHLSPVDAVSKVLQNALVHEESVHCVSLLQQLIGKDRSLAERALMNTIALAQEILTACSEARQSECSTDRKGKLQDRARNATSRVGALLLCSMEHSLVISRQSSGVIDCYFKDVSLDSLRTAFLQIERLQNDYDVYVSLSERLQIKTIIGKTSQFLDEVALCSSSEDMAMLNTKLTAAKRACSLLSGGSKDLERDIWVAASAGIAKTMVQDQDERLLEFLDDVGVLTDAHNDLPARVHVSVALALCAEASKEYKAHRIENGMKFMVMATSLLNDWSVKSSKGLMLSTNVVLATYLDVASQVFSKCDEGIGETMAMLRQTLKSRASVGNCAQDTNQSIECSSVGVNKPILRPSWYIGDGLLLPPSESLALGIQFCKGLVAASRGSRDGSASLFELVSGRGAHSISLRVLSASVAVQTSVNNGLSFEDSFLSDLHDAFGDTAKALVERSLGGTGSGITSSIIDSELAVVTLLTLPVKRAFSAFKSCIPTAVKTQNFARLLNLANIGVLAGSDKSEFGPEKIFSLGWKRQERFLAQCQQLAEKSKWWSILKTHGVKFDSQRFEDLGSSNQHDSKYAASLVPKMIAKMSQTMKSSDVLRLISSYTKTFGLLNDLVFRCHIEYMLSPTKDHDTDMDNSNILGERHSDLHQCEKVVRSSLLALFPVPKRAAVLRRCLISLDKSNSSGQNYELYNLVLHLYQEMLTHVLDHDLTIQDQSPFEIELEMTDRRLDALAILSSFFQGSRRQLRPNFSDFFTAADDASKRANCGILGMGTENENNAFDPLRPLSNLFSSSLDMAAVTSLAPLCLPLGLPRGYIHARLLMTRFRSANLDKTHRPSFENDVFSVLSRIRSPTDRASLAEWCAQQYEGDQTQQLKCLSVVLQSSIEASTEIEQRRSVYPNDQLLLQKEQKALEKVKSVSLTRDSLSDTLGLKKILLTEGLSHSRMVHKLSQMLVDELDESISETPNMSPEALTDLLLTKASFIAATSCLDKLGGCSIGDMRQYCQLVHSARQSVADEHSHIVLSHRTRRFAQRWLFFGDIEGVSNTITEKYLPTVPVQSDLDGIEEEDTMDFVMDLSGIQDDGDEWNAGCSVGKDCEQASDKRVISTEESSAFGPFSTRETSEAACHRAALRVAFALAGCVDSPSDVNDMSTKENLDANRPQIKTTKRKGLLSQLQSKRDSSQQDQILDHSRELLRIVFAEAGSQSTILSRWNSFDSDSSIISIVGREKEPKTITFAMRHRALRSASILCPQDALQEVIREKMYLQSNSNDDNCTLSLCTFGTYLAKEVEEMGLPLPHSDLAKLSTMNFLSYSRTLWQQRHYLDVAGRKHSQGRLLLLLTELSLRNETTDALFVSSLLDEMVRLHLPRTLLLSMEQISMFLDKHQDEVLISSDSIMKAVTFLALTLLTELRALTSASAPPQEASDSDIAETFERFFSATIVFCVSHHAKQRVTDFACAIVSFCTSSDVPLTKSLLKITRGALSSVQEHSTSQ